MLNTSRNATVPNAKAVYSDLRQRVAYKEIISVAWEEYRLSPQRQGRRSKMDLLSAQGVWLWLKHVQYELNQISLRIRDLNRRSGASPQSNTKRTNLEWIKPKNSIWRIHQKVRCCGCRSKISTCIRLSNLCNNRNDQLKRHRPVFSGFEYTKAIPTRDMFFDEEIVQNKHPTKELIAHMYNLLATIA